MYVVSYGYILDSRIIRKPTKGKMSVVWILDIDQDFFSTVFSPDLALRCVALSLLSGSDHMLSRLLFFCVVVVVMYLVPGFSKT